MTRRPTWLSTAALACCAGSLLAAPAAAVTFSEPVAFPAGDGPLAVASGDFDRDSRPDLAVVDFDSESVSVLRGAEAGSFGPPTGFEVGSGPVSVATADFNRDSDLDLVVVNANSDDVSVLLGGPGASFGPATAYDVGDSPQSVAAADFDRDSRPDLAVSNLGGDSVSVLLGAAGGGFGAPTDFSVGDGFPLPMGLTVGNFNRDSRPDLATANSNTTNVSVLVGQGAGVFGEPVFHDSGGESAPGHPRGIASGDFNRDSDPDLVVTNPVSGSVSVLLGGTGASFGPPTEHTVGDRPWSVAVADLDRDSDPDLVVPNPGSHDVSVLLGGTRASFAAAAELHAGESPVAVAIDDLNRDSRPDLAVANIDSDDVSVFLNTTPRPPRRARCDLDLGGSGDALARALERLGCSLFAPPGKRR